MKTRSYILLNIVIFLLGIAVPFTPLWVLEAFFLFIPMMIYAAIFMLMLFLNLVVFNKRRIASALLFLLPLVVFVSGQILSSIAVPAYQESQCGKLIVQLEEYKRVNGMYPPSLNEDMRLTGVTYYTVDDGYTLNFKSGMDMTDVYHSSGKQWERHGWND
jgi:hypothetical protein